MDKPLRYEQSRTSHNKSDADSSGTTTYLDLIANSDLFLDKLHDLPQDSGRIVKDPNVGEEILDLHQLFIEVINRGGIEKVIMDCKCNEVTGIFNLKTEVKNAAYVLRKTDLKMLFELEHVYFFKEPMSSFWAFQNCNLALSEGVHRWEVRKQILCNHEDGIT
ncbi:hypothetical protein Bca101_097426 [Brassica carinata]